jgi:CBS-domain-containing membrane protein
VVCLLEALSERRVYIRPVIFCVAASCEQELQRTLHVQESMNGRESLQPGEVSRSLRRRLRLRDELLLAFLPTATVLLVFGVIEVLSNQRLLFASLASSAFLIYMDPEHGANRTATLAFSQLAAAGTGFLMFTLIGPSYAAGAVAMVTTTIVMIVFDIVHPPAVATAIAFAFRTGDETNVALFALAVGMVVVLVVLETATLALLARLHRRSGGAGD